MPAQLERDAQRQQAAELARERYIVEQENIVFKHAYETRKISKEQYAQVQAAQKARLSDTKGVPVTAQPSAQTQAYVSSVKFYQEIGKPEFAGVYAAPADVPAGLEVYAVKETVTQKGRAGESTQQVKTLEFVLGPEIKYVKPGTISLFGPTYFTVDPKTGEMVEEGARPPTAQEKAKLKARYLKGENIFAMTMEERALAGLVLATGVVTPIVTAPTLALTAVRIGGAVAVPLIGQQVKQSLTGQSLTVPEAIGLAGAGVYGADVAARLAPRVGRYAYEKLFPERAELNAMYNRVVVEQGVDTTAPVGSKSWINQVKNKVLPPSQEKMIFERTVKPGLETKAPPSTGGGQSLKPFEFTETGKVGTKQWVQQVQFKQAPTVKAPMKNFSMEVKTPTSVLFTAPDLAAAPMTLKTKTTKLSAAPSQKAQTIQVERPGATFATSIQVKNPFLEFQGKPFLQRQRARVYDENIYLSYPSQSPLQTPTQVSKAALLQGVYAGQLSKMGQDLAFDSGQIQAFVQAQGVGQVQESVTTQVQDLITEQQTTQSAKQDLKRYWNLDFSFDFGGGGRRQPAVFGGVGRIKRVYPIVTGADFLKNILGQTSHKRKGGRRKK